LRLGDYGFSTTKKKGTFEDMKKFDIVSLGNLLYDLLKPSMQKYSSELKDMVLRMLNGVFFFFLFVLFGSSK
jgi:hypothetical protein